MSIFPKVNVNFDPNKSLQRYMIDLPMIEPPGGRFEYCNRIFPSYGYYNVNQETGVNNETGVNHETKNIYQNINIEFRRLNVGHTKRIRLTERRDKDVNDL